MRETPNVHFGWLVMLCILHGNKKITLFLIFSSSSFLQRPNQIVAIKAITKKNLAKSQNLLGKEIKILKVRIHRGQKSHLVVFDFVVEFSFNLQEYVMFSLFSITSKIEWILSSFSIKCCGAFSIFKKYYEKRIYVTLIY